VNSPTQRSVAEGGAVALIGSSVLFLLPSQVKLMPGIQIEISPRFIPAFVGVGLIILGLALVLQSALGGPKSNRIDLDKTTSLRILITVLLMLAYTTLFPLLGFVVTSAVFVGFFTIFFGARIWWKIAIVIVMIPVAVWLFFEKIFRIPLPHGFLY